MCIYFFGGISPTNPRVDIHIITGEEDIVTFVKKTLEEKVNVLYSINVDESEVSK